MVYIHYCFISENNHKKIIQEFLLRFSFDFQNKITGYRRWQDTQLSLPGRIILYRGADNFNEKYKETCIRGCGTDLYVPLTSFEILRNTSITDNEKFF